MLTSIIIPTLNESKNIELLINEIRGSLKDRYSDEIVVVDDNSPDGTYKIVKEISKKDKRIVPVCRVGKKGLSSAILKGFGHAKGEILGVMDADLSHPPKLIPKMVDGIIKRE